MKTAGTLATTLFLASGLLAAVTGAHAVTLSLAPAATTVTEGASFSIEIVVSDLGDLSAPSLSGFDLEIGYDPMFLQADTVSFGDPVLGDQLDLFGLGALSAFDLTTAGSVALAEVSFDTIADLDTLQPSAFTLAAIDFTALAETPAGSPTVLFVDSFPGSLFGLPALLIDSPGFPLDPITLVAAEVVVEPSAAPESGSLSLLLLGIVVLAAAGRLHLGA
jgi:hypothetical protein